MVKKSVLNNLLKKYTLKDVEKHLTYSYLVHNNLDYKNHKILLKYFDKLEYNEDIYSIVNSLKIIEIKNLENYLELLIPKSDKKINGAFFTPSYIVDFIINEIKPKNNHKNLDPSCGCGAFLIGLVEYYRRTFEKSIREIVKQNIFGADILKYNIDRAKLLLSLYALKYNEVLEERDFNLYCQDSLNIQWKEKYDNVVGNPPYVKFQDLSKELRLNLPENWKTIKEGTYNLYFAFFELGYKLLKPTGHLGYITPNNYFTSLAGKSIRKYFHENKCVFRIIDFNSKKVFDAQVYTAITFINKKKNLSIAFDRIGGNYEPKDFLFIANGSPNYLKDLNIEKWRLLKAEERTTIEKIENIGIPIGDLFNISTGIATLKDEVFFVDGSKESGNFYLKTTDNKTYKIEKNITRVVYKISDFKNQDEIQRNSRRIIFPYTIHGQDVQPINEEEFKKEYPECYKYLKSERKVLSSRDKGKVKFSPFYIWGRNQGINRNGIKILTPTFSQYPRFLLVEEDAYFTNGYGIYFKKDKEIKYLIEKIENIDIVQKILNSSLMHYYISITSVSIEGGYPCYQKNFIEKFTIPNFNQEELNSLRGLNSQGEIDEFLMTRYQVNIPEPKRLSWMSNNVCTNPL